MRYSVNVHKTTDYKVTVNADDKEEAEVKAIAVVERTSREVEQLDVAWAVSNIEEVL